ncbi:glycosyltransferase family 2 protein [Moraxella sp. ZY200743]|uniref:glycosyltransferase family 2 protein n=1 Tax=Moraxella sp. ZY200743 TaxID=2911970 RepID=UPI003D7ED8A1
MKYKLSVVMIVKNEARNLAISLPALDDLADEIIILDSGSTDNSREIAEKYGAKWYVNTDWQGFGKQRQIAQSYATGDWILAIDADEEITAELKQSILQVIQNKPDQIVYGIRNIDCIFGKNEIDVPNWRIKSHWRLYPKHIQFNDNAVHESLVLSDKMETQTLSGYARHHTAESPLFWLNKRLSYALTWAEEKFQHGKDASFSSILIHTIGAFFKQYLLDGRFLKGKYGYLYALLFMQYTFNKYAILYDLKHNQAERAFLDYNELTKQQQPVDLSQKKSTLSLVMITKNESKHLQSCLDTIHDIVDEIIILDSGSTDHTRQIAEQYGAKWYVNTDWQGFGKQRQLAQSYASSDYVLVLDADERVDGCLRQEIVEKVLNYPIEHEKVFSVSRVNLFCGVETQPRFWKTNRLARIYDREKFQYSSLEVHESLDQQGAPSKLLAGYLPHITNDNLHHFLFKNVRYSHDWAIEAYKKGKRVNILSIFWRAWFSFIKIYLIRGGFLSGTYGLILAIASFGYTLDKYLMLWQMNKDNNNQHIKEH